MELFSIEALEKQADDAFDADREDAQAIADEAAKRYTAHQERRKAAEAKLATFTEAQQDSGLLNAADTFAENGLKDIDPTRFAEYWEMAVDSAQVMVDCDV